LNKLVKKEEECLLNKKKKREDMKDQSFNKIKSDGQQDN